MITPGTQIRLALVPIERIVVTEHQPRFRERVLHYYRLLQDPAHAHEYPGFVTLRRTVRGQLTILDGHHRYLAHVMAGRTHILALIHTLPNETDDPDAMAVVPTLPERHV
jgi:hypothetical protein